MKPYPKYKDSGIEWLGEVPVEWHITNLRRLSSVISKGTTPSTLGKDMVDEGVRFIKGENIQGGEVVDTPAHFIDIETDDILSRSRLQAHDVLFVIAGSIGKTAIVKESDAPANTNQAICFIRLCNTNHSKYVHYWLSTDLVQQLVSLDLVQTAQPNVSMDDIGRIPLLVADTAETNAIASFLDRETARIDALIQKKERMIELLKEKRIALITQAVTKGLDPNVPMKESGIEWLGEVPERWDIIRTDSVTDYLRDQINPEDIKSDMVFHYSIPIVQETGTGQLEPTEDLGSAKQLITKKAILVSKLNPRKATICSAEPQDEVTICSSEFVAIEATKCDIEYLYYLVSSEKNRQRLDASVQSVTRSHQRVYPSDIYKFWTALPIWDEQVLIASFLDRETARIDALISKIYDSIYLLREYRASLIHHAVTGKIDLRGYDAQAQ